MCSLRFEFEDNWTKRTGVLWRPFSFLLNPLKQDLVLLCFFGLFGVIGRCWLQDSQWHPRDPSNNHTLSHAARKINNGISTTKFFMWNVVTAVLSVRRFVCTSHHLHKKHKSLPCPVSPVPSEALKMNATLQPTKLNRIAHNKQLSERTRTQRLAASGVVCGGNTFWGVTNYHPILSNLVIVLFYPYVHSWDSVIGRNRRSKWAGRWKNMLEKPSDSTVWQC